MVGRRVEGEREKEEDKKGGVRWAVFLELWEKKNVLKKNRSGFLSVLKQRRDPELPFHGKEYTRIHPLRHLFLSISSFFPFLFFFSFLLIFAHFSTPISAHDPKKDWKESRANVSRVPPGINFLLFCESPRKSRLRIQHNISFFIPIGLFKYTPFQRTLLLIVNRVSTAR